MTDTGGHEIADDYARLFQRVNTLTEMVIGLDKIDDARAELLAELYRGIGALTEQLNSIIETAATRDDLDNLRAELLGLVAEATSTPGSDRE